MPLFGSKRKNKPVAEPVPEQRAGLFHRRDPSPTYAQPAQPQKTGLFHRNHTPPPAPVQNSTSPSRGGLFHRRNSPTASVSSAGSTHHHGMTNGVLSKNRYDDESIVAARERVTIAERAEADADKAMQQARSAVYNARQEVKRLEEEAALQSKLAKHKADTSKAISKRARPLGRHGP